MTAALILIVLLLALVAAFAVQNPGILTVHFLHLSVSTSLLVVIVVAFVMGVAVGLLWLIQSLLRCRRRVRELTAEVDSLRRTPAPSRAERP